MVQWLCVLGGIGLGNYILVATAEASLSHGRTMSVVSFAGMYGYSLTLDSPSEDDLTCVSVLLLSGVRHQLWRV